MLAILPQKFPMSPALDPKWLEAFPSFLKLREIDLYGVIYRSYDVNDLSSDPWVSRFMAGRRERLEAGLPYVDIDFRAFAPYL